MCITSLDKHYIDLGYFCYLFIYSICVIHVQLFENFMANVRYFVLHDKDQLYTCINVCILYRPAVHLYLVQTSCTFVSCTDQLYICIMHRPAVYSYRSIYYHPPGAARSLEAIHPCCTFILALCV